MAVVSVALGVLGAAVAAQAAPRVVATIPAVHSLASAVMDGVGTPYLLLRGGASPHSYALRPSDVRAMSDADLIFWIGAELETFLARRLKEEVQAGRAISLLRAPGVELLHVRDAVANGHSDHGHGHGHKHDGEYDAHIWLSPDNAMAMAAAIVAALSRHDPHRAAVYEANAQRLKGQLAALKDELRQRLAPVRDRPYVVFHDAYQYFEHAFDLEASGSVTISPERRPGARRLSNLRQMLLQGGSACVFVEPQFEPKLVHSIVEGSAARVATLDPVGANLEPGPDAYFALLRGLANDFAACLAVATH